MVKVWIGNGDGGARKVSSVDSFSERYEITDKGNRPSASDSGVFSFDESHNPTYRHEITRPDSFQIDRISVSAGQTMKYVVRFGTPIEVNGRTITGVKLGQRELAYLTRESPENPRRVGDIYDLDQSRLMALIKKHTPQK